MCRGKLKKLRPSRLFTSSHLRHFRKIQEFFRSVIVPPSPSDNLLPFISVPRILEEFTRNACNHYFLILCKSGLISPEMMHSTFSVLPDFLFYVRCTCKASRLWHLRLRQAAALYHLYTKMPHKIFSCSVS
jgi:hypothetical protein